ncbi:MAG: hypothetical protein IPH12_13990 [Saprospirales bacterium]|nr:hypothetical protein [Saprospirales bacterium]MBK8922845.1 hypothetical protein [Saprospirales bacterium]
MATAIAYRRVFEVRLLHEYYLFGSDALSYFDKPAATRRSLFEKRILNRQYLLANDLSIEPAENTQRLLKGLKWRFVRTSAGFAVAAPSKTATTNGNTVFQPAILPAGNAELFFIISSRNPYFTNFTSLLLQKSPLPARYYFSNRAEAVHDAEFATLSAPALAFDAGKIYEMGQFAMKDGLLKEFMPSLAPNADPWRQAPGIGYVNESDRIALPKIFPYAFKKSDQILQATIRLETPANELIKTIQLSAGKPIERAQLDFSSRPDPIQSGKKISIPDGRYRLSIDAGPVQEALEVYLTDVYATQSFAIVRIDLGETDPVYRILNADSSFRNLNPDPAGKPFHPVFEIRLRARSTYWRYKSRYLGQSLAVNPSLTAYLEADGNSVITKAPQALSFLPLGVRSSNPANPPVDKLPNPLPDLIRPQPPNLLLSEINTWKIAGKID